MKKILLIPLCILFFILGALIEKFARNLTRDLYLSETSRFRSFFSRPWIPGAFFMVSGLLLFYVWGGSFSFFIAFLLTVGLFFSALTDLYSGYIFDAVPAVMGVGSFVFRWAAGTSPLLDGIMGALAGIVIMAFVRWISRGGMGIGDVKLIGGMGLGLGLPLTLYGLYIGILVGGIVAGWLLLTHRVHRKQPIPFGPFIALGGIIALATAPFLGTYFNIVLVWPWGC